MHVRVGQGANAHQQLLESAARRSFEQKPQELPIVPSGSRVQPAPDAAKQPPPPVLDSPAASAGASRVGVCCASDA